FGGGYRRDSADALVEEIEREGKALEESLHDPARATVVWVTLPEALPVAETRDAVAALEGEGIPVREILVNRVTPEEAESCPVCRERRLAEMGAIEEIREAFAGRELRFLPAQEREPRGLAALRRLGAPGSCGMAGWLEGALSRASARGRVGDGAFEDAGKGATAPSWFERFAPPGARLLLFGGKGGVGKTTCAAATALTLAQEQPERRLLLISTDPAHSLGDALATPMGDEARPVPGAPPGLRVRELDAARVFAAWRDRHRETVGEALGSFSSEGEALAADLLDAPPPGLDELVALSTLLDAVLGPGAAPIDLVIVDTAPTGHALRLLEMPALALAWDHAMLSLLLKYREAVGLGDLAAELVELSRSLKRFQALLADPARTRFVAVTRAAELPRRETVRLLDALRELSIEVPAVVVNATTQTNPDCRFCAAAGGLQKREVRALAAAVECDIIETPAVYPPPRGAAALAAWARTWKAPSR
ncbi:MAG TPA: TRC40/GET3/ArsA family transport-energizing ATPase, partial [Thermoanaerobaculia bacterium]|nr:TRC40/GET3/ArsA family transport-energizing ATPase [Thermoanaerobaculia bacterium]